MYINDYLINKYYFLHLFWILCLIISMQYTMYRDEIHTKNHSLKFSMFFHGFYLLDLNSDCTRLYDISINRREHLYFVVNLGNTLSVWFANFIIISVWMLVSPHFIATGSKHTLGLFNLVSYVNSLTEDNARADITVSSRKKCPLHLVLHKLCWVLLMWISIRLYNF